MAGITLLGYGVLGGMSVALVRGEPVGWALAWRVGFFVCLSILVGLQQVPLPRGGATATVGFAVDLATLLIFGPALAAWIGVLSLLVLLRRSSALKQLFNHGQVILAFFGAGQLYVLLGGRYLEWSQAPVAFGTWRASLALLGASSAYFSVSSLLVSCAMALYERRSAWGMWSLNFRWPAPRYLALAPFGLLMAMVYRAEGLGIGAVALFLVPLVGARYAFQGAMEMLQVHRQTVYALCRALEAYDPYTRNHSEVVTRCALQLGKELGLSVPRLETLEWAGRLHDIGKCRQDWDAIIRKPGKPSEAEWRIIRQHPVEGARLAEKMEFLPHTAGEVARIVRAHHERVDGSGYPAGLRGEEIPLEARILGVADAFEAMTATRAYLPRRSPEAALAELKREAGKQFDEAVTAAMGRLFARGEVEVAAGQLEQPPEPMLAVQAQGGG
jgi:putative nucleotidyltransferase with HDIG domain